MDILQKLMEGAGNCAEPEEVKIDPEVEENINESTMPMSMLIETFMVNSERDINRAYEVYEMASIIGTTQVLQEGTNVQEAAAAVMEGNIKDFFGKIIQKLREIGQWIAGIFKKIIGKGKNEEDVIKKDVAAKIPVAEKKVEEAASASSGSTASDDDSKQYYYRGDIWNPNGDKSFDAAMAGLNNVMGKVEDLAKAITENWDYNAMQNKQWKDVNNAAKDAYKEDNVITTEKLSEHLMKTAFGKETKGAGTSTVTKSLKEAYGVGSAPGPNERPTVVTPKLLEEMKKVLTGQNSVVKDLDKAEKDFQKRKDNIIKSMTKIQQTAEKTQAHTEFVTKRCTQVTSSVNAIAGMYVQVANAKKDAYISIINSYRVCINQIAQSKREEGVTDGVDYRYIIESFECCGDPILEGLDASDDGGMTGGFSSASSIFSQLGGFLSI